MVSMYKKLIESITGLKSALTCIIVTVFLGFALISLVCYLVGTFTNIAVDGKWLLDFLGTISPMCLMVLGTTCGCSIAGDFLEKKYGIHIDQQQTESQ